MRDFNERVQIVSDAHERAHGYRPTPSTVLVAAKSQVPKEKLPRVFQIPRTRAAAQAAPFFKPSGFGTLETTDPLAGAAGIVPGSSLVPDDLRLAADRFQAMSREEKREFFQRVGELAPGQRMRLLRRAGYLSSGSQPVGRQEVQTAGVSREQLSGAAGAFDYGFKAFVAGAGGLALGVPVLAYEQGKGVKESVEQRSPMPFVETQVGLAKDLAQFAEDVYNDPLAPEHVGGAIFGAAAGGTAVAGAAARVGAAAKQKGRKRFTASTAEGGSLLHRPPAGRTTVVYGNHEVELLNSGNPLVRPVQLAVRRQRERRANERFKDGQTVPTDGIFVYDGKRTFRGKTFAWERKMGREAERRTRLERDLRMMTVRDLEQAAGWTRRWQTVREKLPDKALGGLSRGEQMALVLRSLDDPNPLATMRRFHAEKIVEGPKPWTPRMSEADWNGPEGQRRVADWESIHRQKLRDLDAAEKALANPSDRFQRAAALVDRAVDEMEQIKFDEAGLSVATAEGRVAKAAEVFRTGEPFVAISKLEKEIDKLRAKPKLTGAEQRKLDGLIDQHVDAEARLAKLGRRPPAFFHGSAADPRRGRTRPGDQSGFFMTEDPAHAAWYAHSEEMGGPSGKVYAAAAPKNPLDLGKRGDAEKIVAAMEADAGRLDDKYLDGELEKSPRAFVREVERARTALDSSFKISGTGDVPAIDSALRGAALEMGRLRGSEGFDTSYLAEIVRRLGADAFITRETNKANGSPARVAVYVERPDDLREFNPDEVPAKAHYMPFVSAAKRKKLPQHTLRGSRLNMFGGLGRKNRRQVFPEVYHEFTGAAIIAGDYRIDATGLVGEALGNAVQGAFRMSQYRALLEQATPNRKSQYDRPILKPDADGWPDEVKAFLLRPDEGQVTKQDAIALSRQDWQDMQRHLYPGEPKDGQWTVPAGQLDSVLWVDERMLAASAQKPPLSSAFVRGLEAGQSIFRVPSLYLKPSYLLNLLSNQVTALITTGPLAPVYTARALFHKQWMDDSTWNFFAESVGVGKFGSYVDETFSGRQSRRIAHFWNRLTDQHARVGAALYHAEKLGYKTPDDLRKLVEAARRDPDSKAFEDLLEIKDRTNKDMVQVDNLTWVEQNVVRHVLYVYPWRRGQAVWSLRALVEHPIKAEVVLALGTESGEEIVDELGGKVAEWFERGGYIPTRVGKDGTAVINPATLHTWGDLATLVDPDSPRMLGPAGQLIRERFKADDYSSPVKDAHEVKKWIHAFRKVFESLPQVRAVKGADEETPLPAFDVTDRDTLITRMNAADSWPVLSAPGFWGLVGGALVPRELDRLALQADWYKELPQEERHRFNVALRETVLGVQAQALGRPVPDGVRDALARFNQLEKHVAGVEDTTGRDLTPDERTLAEIEFYAKRKLVDAEQAQDLRREVKRLPDDDAHREFRSEMKQRFLDPDGALSEWDSDVQMVAKLSRPKVVNQRLRELAADGLLGAREARSVGESVKTLRTYGRKVLDWVEKKREWRDRLDAESDPDEERVLWQEYREWLNETDRPMQVGSVLLPSPARIDWAATDADTRREIVADRAGRSWGTLSSLDKKLLGREVPATVAGGWRLLEQTLVDQQAQLPPGERLPNGHERTLARWADRAHPGFYKDWLFSKEPLARRLQGFEFVRKSRHAKEWRELLGVAAQYSRYLTDDYKKSEVRDSWKLYVRETLQPWVDSRPGFKAEVSAVHPQLVFQLLD